MPIENLERRIIELDQPFSRVKLSGTGRFTIAQGERPSVSILADRRIVDKVVVRIMGEILYVYLERDVYDLDKIFFEPSYEIVTAAVVTVDVSGELIGTLSGYGDRLRLILSGLTNISAEKLSTARLDAEVSGSSRLTISGTADLAALDLSGSSMISAMDLKASRGRVVVRGSAKASVFVTEYLDAAAGGAGRIIYRGHPQVVQRQSGFGRVIADG